ncbi:hypothetical protein HID58_015496 [Brassica napus]|uniref:Uncharacterized protein n=1 Tax=Brassica napus TaxID=3708 RepID=A0ABQ8DK88_BRANA|nr:hypothetical protein HID58_015496 [Brassica napus]
MSVKSFDKVLLEKELKKLRKMEEFKPNMKTGCVGDTCFHQCQFSADGKAIKSHFTCDGNSGIAKVIVSTNCMMTRGKETERNLPSTSLNGHSNMSMAFRRSLVVYYFQIFELNKEVAEKNKET